MLVADADVFPKGPAVAFEQLPHMLISHYKLSVGPGQCKPLLALPPVLFFEEFCCHLRFPPTAVFILERSERRLETKSQWSSKLQQAASQFRAMFRSQLSTAQQKICKWANPRVSDPLPTSKCPQLKRSSAEWQLFKSRMKGLEHKQWRKDTATMFYFTLHPHCACLQSMEPQKLWSNAIRALFLLMRTIFLSNKNPTLEAGSLRMTCRTTKGVSHQGNEAASQTVIVHPLTCLTAVSPQSKR